MGILSGVLKAIGNVIKTAVKAIGKAIGKVSRAATKGVPKAKTFFKPSSKEAYTKLPSTSKASSKSKLDLSKISKHPRGNQKEEEKEPPLSSGALEKVLEDKESKLKLLRDFVRKASGIKKSIQVDKKKSTKQKL